MLDILNEHFEREATIELTKAAEEVRRNQRTTLAYHALLLLAGALSFIIIFFGKTFAANFPVHGQLIEAGTAVAAVFIMLICSIGRTNLTTIVGILKRYDSFSNWLQKNISRDFLWPYFIAGRVTNLCFITLILISVFIQCSLNEHSQITNQESYNLTLDKFFTAAFTILGLQVGLFNFLFGQLLGKYSSMVVRTVIEHPAVNSVRNLALLNLLLPVFARLGIPDWVQVYLISCLIISNLICFLLSLGIAKTGIEADKAITYSAFRFSLDVLKHIKSPIAKSKYSWLWTILSLIGLDWRDPKRFVSIGEPSNSQFVRDRLTILLGICGKAIEDNQRDILIVALTAITRVMHAYTQRRALYYGSTDQVFSYLNDQLSVLLRATSDSKNEYLVADLVKYIGTLGQYVFYIGQMPTDTNEARETRIRRQSQSHPIASAWIGLLQEAFNQTFVLMRSTAAHGCIVQIRNLALSAYLKEWPAVLTLAFLPAIERIHTQCMLNFDAYRRNLATECVRAILIVWYHAASKSWVVRSNHDFFYHVCEFLERMGKRQIPLQNTPAFDFQDFETALTKKLDDNTITIQDIFYIILNRQYTKDWERQSGADDIIKILKLIILLGKESIAQNATVLDDYTDTLYDLAYLVFRGLPKSFTDIEIEKNPSPYRPKTIPVQEVLDVQMLDATAKLFKASYTKDDYVGFSWMQHCFGIIGHAIAAYKTRGGEYLRTKLVEIISGYNSYIQAQNSKPDERVSDEDFDYLQLAGSWTASFLNEKELSESIANFVATKRPFHDGLFGSSSYYAQMGYPEIMHSDYYLPSPKAVLNYLNEQDRANFIQMQNMLISDDVLRTYSEVIQLTRDPLRKAYYERLRNRRDAPKKTQSKPPSSSSVEGNLASTSGEKAEGLSCPSVENETDENAAPLAEDNGDGDIKA